MQNKYADSSGISQFMPESARRADGQTKARDYGRTIDDSNDARDRNVGALNSVIETLAKDIPGSSLADLEKVTQDEPDVVSILSHELLSPVTLIKGYTAILLQLGDNITEEEKEQYIQNIESAADKLTRLLENIRDIAYFESSGLNILVKPISLTRLLWKTVSEVQNQTSKHILKLNIIRPLPRLNIDRQKIEIVINNLLANAIKYSPQGGDIDIVVSKSENKELEEIFGKTFPTKPGYVSVSVTDLGVGINDTELERIFQKFYRVENRLTRATAGAGLGLYICKAIIEAHGGRIWATSQPGVGSTFSFTLPV